MEIVTNLSDLKFMIPTPAGLGAMPPTGEGVPTAYQGASFRCLLCEMVNEFVDL